MRVALQRELVRKTLAAIFGLPIFREQVAYMPRCIAQGIIFLGVAVDFPPGFERFPIGLVEQLTLAVAHTVIPPRTAKYVIPLMEAFEVRQDVETGLFVSYEVDG